MKVKEIECIQLYFKDQIDAIISESPRKWKGKGCPIDILTYEIYKERLIKRELLSKNKKITHL